MPGTPAKTPVKRTRCPLSPAAHTSPALAKTTKYDGPSTRRRRPRRTLVAKAIEDKKKKKEVQKKVKEAMKVAMKQKKKASPEKGDTAKLAKEGLKNNKRLMALHFSELSAPEKVREVDGVTLEAALNSLREVCIEKGFERMPTLWIQELTVKYDLIDNIDCSPLEAPNSEDWMS